MTKRWGGIPLNYFVMMVFTGAVLMNGAGEVAKYLGDQISYNSVDCSWYRLLYSWPCSRICL